MNQDEVLLLEERPAKNLIFKTLTWIDRRSLGKQAEPPGRCWGRQIPGYGFSRLSEPSSGKEIKEKWTRMKRLHIALHWHRLPRHPDYCCRLCSEAITSLALSKLYSLPSRWVNSHSCLWHSVSPRIHWNRISFLRTLRRKAIFLRIYFCEYKCENIFSLS